MSLWDSTHWCPGCHDIHPFPECRTDTWSVFCEAWDKVARYVDGQALWNRLNLNR